MKEHKIIRLKLSVVLFIFIIFGNGAAKEFSLDPQSGTDSVQFKSAAKLEFLSGETKDLIGNINFDFDNPTNKITGVIRVDLRTLKTGIETRDGHMRDNHLHTDKFPYAYFELLSVANLPAKVIDQQEYKLEVTGYFYIHGVKRQLTSDLSLKRGVNASGKDQLNIKTNFSIFLDAYKIPRPKALFLKLAERVTIQLSFSAIETVDSEKIVLPLWDELQN